VLFLLLLLTAAVEDVGARGSDLEVLPRRVGGVSCGGKPLVILNGRV